MVLGVGVSVAVGSLPRVLTGVGVVLGVAVSVTVGSLPGVLTSVGVVVAVWYRSRFGVAVTEGVTVGVAMRVVVLAGVREGSTITTNGVSVWVGVPVATATGVWSIARSDVGVSVGSDEHQGAVKENWSKIQVRLPPPVHVVWKTSRFKPGKNRVP